MSLSALHQAFVARRISRGAFIRRIVGFGMSLPVARHYASALEQVAVAQSEESPTDFCASQPEFCQDHCAEDPYSPLCAVTISRRGAGL